VVLRRIWPSPQPEKSAADAARSPSIDRLLNERALMDEILERMSEGILVFDETLTPVLANRAARGLLGLDGLPMAGDLPSDEILSLARRVVTEEADSDDVIDLRYPERTSVRVTASYLQEQGGVVLVLRDVSSEQRAHLMRRQFVTHASHELKTPIASIQALAEAVRDASEAEPDKARQFSERLVQESERLSRLVADLLDLSRVEDPGTIASAVADVSALARRELDDAGEQARSKGVELHGAISDAVFVRGDASQLALMIRNLLDNAISYTPAEGEVSVDVWSDEDEAIVKVADTGVGIPLRHQARVFERFYRVDSSRSREAGGTGLGLAIVKHVADLHGGHVELTSELDEGSTFTVRLPALDSR
jgi:two-component system, OmpR family, phosphate regulon sensor histidine kinase PhoR